MNMIRLCARWGGKLYQNFFLIITLAFLLIFPNLLWSAKNGDISFALTSFIFGLPVAALVLSLKNKTVIRCFASFFCLLSICETILVAYLGNFVIAGNIWATLTTTAEESSSFLRNSLYIIWYILPLFLCLILFFFLTQKIAIQRNIHITILTLSSLVAIGFVTYKQVRFYHGLLTTRFYIENRILNRPPYNIFLQTKNLIHGQRLKRYIKESERFSFLSEKKDTLREKEIYVLGIGESMRYDKLSLNGYYRTTTPNLDTTSNLVSFKNYYSTACLTMYSVPQIMTRATPQDYELNFKERSIILPFKECGFHTFCIVTGNLLSYETYLTNGVDSLYIVQEDKRIPELIDSLASLYEKTFFVVQFLGNHSFYENFTPEYDIFHPNSVTERNMTEISRDTLLNNSYDNTVLYADHILSDIIRRINRPQINSSFLFTSDHGETNGWGHGGNCSPIVEEYHVPLLIWYSSRYKDNYPDKVINIHRHKDSKVNADNVFYSVCDMANIRIAEQYSHDEWSVFSDRFLTHTRYVLVPDGINFIQVD